MFDFLEGLFEIVRERRGRFAAWLSVIIGFVLLLPLILFLVWWGG